MSFFKIQQLYYFLCFYFLLFQNAEGKTLEAELTLNPQQKVKLDKLRDLVVNRVPHSYMSEDFQLFKWLKVNKFDVRAAGKMIMENVKWREENKMDTILDEDFSDFDAREYKFTLEGCKDGRPVVSFDIGDWPIRTIVLSGRTDRFLRYSDKLVEEGAVLLRELQKAGHNVTEFVDLYDFTNFNSRNHLCLQCLRVYIHLTQTAEKHYPLLSHKSIMVNVPSVFNALYQILLGFVSDETKATFVVYGRDQRDWKETLRKDFGAENLSKQFGGDNDDVYDVEEVRKNPSLFKCH